MNRQENTRTMVVVFSGLSLAVIWFALMAASSYDEEIGLFVWLERLMLCMNQPFNIHINQYSMKFVLVFLFAYAMGIGIYFTSRENRRPGEEHGSAKWGDVKSIAKKYADTSNKPANLILSQSLRLGLNAKKHRRNLNVLVVGGSGAGKTIFFAKPNILQCNTSFVVADPNGESVLVY